MNQKTPPKTLVSTTDGARNCQGIGSKMSENSGCDSCGTSSDFTPHLDVGHVHSAFPQVRLTLDQTGAAPEPQDTCSLQKKANLLRLGK